MSGPYRPDPAPPCEACAKRSSERRKAAIDWLQRNWGAMGLALLCLAFISGARSLMVNSAEESRERERQQEAQQRSAEACAADCYVRDYTRFRILSDRCLCFRDGRRALEVEESQ